MDENKKTKLEEIGFKLLECCALCKHSTFVGGYPASGFGTCGVHSYEHQKHSEKRRALSINIAGWCPAFESDEGAMRALHGFAPFLEKKEAQGS